MAAPESTVWGSVVIGSANSSGRQGKIGIYKSISSTDTTTTVTIQIWFKTKYSVSDANNDLYFNTGTSISAATTKVDEDISISHTVSSGSGWSTSNESMLWSKTYTYSRGKSAVTYKAYAKLSGIDIFDGPFNVNTTYTVPALASYTISYNANGGSGAPSSQTKYYGINLTLSSTKPTRTGYTFQGWGTSTGDTSVDYAPGATYSANAGDTLYAIWKANTYVVKYDANGGSGAPGNQTKTYGVDLTLSSTKPTRSRYTFKGWGTSANATSASYSAGGKYTANAAITLYAVWELAYVKPKVTINSAYRCDSSGSEDEAGTYAIVNARCETFLDSMTVTVSWKPSSASSWSNVSNTVNAKVFTGGILIGNGDLDLEIPYDIKVTVTDELDNYYRSTSIAGQFFTTDELVGGRGYAVGKAAELSNYFDVGFYSRFRKDVYFDTFLRSKAEPTNASGMRVKWSGQEGSGDADLAIKSSDGLTSYFGPADIGIESATNLRGKTVRLYAHSGGGVYLGYSGSTAITSDRNLKKDILDVDDKYIEFFEKLRPVTYKYDVKKNSSHRDHVGYIAQEVEEALTTSGLTTEQFAGICIERDVTLNPDYDSSMSKEEIQNSSEHYDELYSLRYEEFIALNTLMIQRANARIAKLEEEVAELKRLIIEKEI